MKKATRAVVYDEQLNIEAYRFKGMVQPFPNHFHEYYVIGLMEKGERRLYCKNKEYTIRPGNMMLLNVGENHSCVQSNEQTMYYRCINISKQVMKSLCEEIKGDDTLPIFSQNIIFDKEINYYMKKLHVTVMKGSTEFDKEENLLLLLSLLIQKYSQSFESIIPECSEEIEKACIYMQNHISEHIYLEQICKQIGLSKSTLLRAFTKTKGVTPYRYLENIRINKAKELLEQGLPPVAAALMTGFSDQSHFTNYFHRFIGLTPGMYSDIFKERY